MSTSVIVTGLGGRCEFEKGHRAGHNNVRRMQQSWTNTPMCMHLTVSRHICQWTCQADCTTQGCRWKVSCLSPQRKREMRRGTTRVHY